MMSHLMAHYEPPHQDLRYLQIQLFSSLVLIVLNELVRIQGEKLPISFLPPSSIGVNS